MTFVNSLWWAGLAALLPAIVIMYLLKLKRRRVVMPSTLLWRRSVQDMVANAPFQKLRNNLLMWLQLLFLALLILAFLRPVTELTSRAGQTLILLIDHSASMQTVEAGQTRLDAAKEAAMTAIENLDPEDEAIVVTFSDRTNIVQTLTSDRALLEDAVEGIDPRDTGSSLREAGLILQGLTTFVNADGARLPRENVQVILFSDGAVTGLDALTDVPDIEYVRVGESMDNLGISNIDIRESYATDFQYQIFASVTNSSDEEREALVQLEVDGELIDIRSTMLEPGETAPVVFTTAEMLDGIAQVRIDGADSFPLDDSAIAQIAPPTDIEILIVSEGNPFLEEVLLVDPRVQVSLIRPTDYTPRDEFDVVVFDNVEAPQLPPGNFLFVNSIPPMEGFTVTGDAVTNPEIIDWNRVHPLTRFANFEDVLIGQALQYDPPTGAVPILEALETDLITLYEDESRNIVVIGFDIFQSYWPLDVSFPIFMTNLVDYYSEAAQGSYRPVYTTGSTIPIYPGREATTATVRTPTGDEVEFNFEGISTAFLTETGEAGLYTVTFDDGSERYLPVNLLDRSESTIAPAENLEIGNRVVAGQVDELQTDTEIWHWFVLAALGFMLVEWLIYCKRTFM